MYKNTLASPTGEGQTPEETDPQLRHCSAPSAPPAPQHCHSNKGKLHPVRAGVDEGTGGSHSCALKTTHSTHRTPSHTDTPPFSPTLSETQPKTGSSAPNPEITSSAPNHEGAGLYFDSIG